MQFLQGKFKLHLEADSQNLGVFMLIARDYLTLYHINITLAILRKFQKQNQECSKLISRCHIFGALVRNHKSI